jgi:3-methyladenine DNA glycosylase/8-oxoguanine DNA glycosylase/alkylated DNA nucleotide flippase Atl1
VPQPSLTQAIEEVRGRDPVLAHLVDLVGPLRHPPRFADGHFGALARSIVYQQLAGRAAQAILGRVVAAAGGRLSPEALAAVPDEALRAAGLSANKLASLRDLTARVLMGGLNLNRLSRLGDEEAIAQLVTVRGIGRWSAEMYLIFELRRLDVWPVEDFGVRQGYGVAWGITPPPTAKALAPLGEPFRPYRSVVARYCWEAVALFRRGVNPGPQPAPATDEDLFPPSPEPLLGTRASRILARIRAIPEGFVQTYGDIDPNAPRLVGAVLANASDDVPWHRVVRADGTVAKGPRQLERLRVEGVAMRGDRVDLRRARGPEGGVGPSPAGEPRKRVVSRVPRTGTSP